MCCCGERFSHIAHVAGMATGEASQFLLFLLLRVSFFLVCMSHYNALDRRSEHLEHGVGSMTQNGQTVSLTGAQQDGDATLVAVANRGRELLVASSPQS